jgi:hypothetical protein
MLLLNLNPCRHPASVFADLATMAGLGCVAVKWSGGGVEGVTRLKNFGALDGKIAVLSHIKGLYKTALLKANIGRVSVVQSSVLYAYIQHRA